jgi:hypothetical protein
VSAIAVQGLIALLKGALLKYGYCMTYEEENGFHVGVCANVEVDSLNVTTDDYIRLLNNLVSFYGIWNLDFFHYIIPPFLRLSLFILTFSISFQPSILYS